MGYSTIDADEYRERLSVRRELEPQPGKSRALNRAIDAAKDEYILDGRDGAAKPTRLGRAVGDHPRPLAQGRDSARPHPLGRRRTRAKVRRFTHFSTPPRELERVIARVEAA